MLDQNDDDQGLDPRLVYTAPSDGIYLIRTFAFPAATNSSIHFSGGANWIYRLTLTTGGFVDHVMPLVVTRGTPTEVVAAGSNLGSDPLKLAVPVEDRDRVLLTGAQFGNTVSLATVAHPVLLEVEPNAAMQAQVIPVPGGVSGVVSAVGDVDAFSFAAKKGQPLLFKVFARKIGSPIDPVLSIFDATGKQLQRLDDQGENRDPEISWNPPADGQYSFQVSDLHNRGGERFYYHVNIAPPQPDYRLSLAAENFVLPIDKPLEIPVTIDRQAGFKGEIEVSIEGLPEGVTASPVKSAGEGDTAKAVKLILNGNSAPFSGTIRVLATTTMEPKLNRTANFPLPDYDASLEQIWLTVIKKP